MKCTSMWSYRPYRPMDWPHQTVEVARMAPGPDNLELDYWPETTVEVRWRGPQEGRARLVGGHGRLEGLEPGGEYALSLALPGGVFGPWIPFRTGFVPGQVVNYLHPQDERYSFSGRYLCSPSLAMLPSGALVASMDVYAPREPQNLTLVMISRDGGISWRPQCQLFPCFWGKLFVHGGTLYMLGVSTEYGDLLIARSDDEGASFGAPTRLLPGSGRSARGGVHRAPVPVIEAGGRLYTAVEWGGWEMGGHASAMLSAPSGADLLRAESWSVTPLTAQDTAWPGAAAGPAMGMLEGNAVEGPDGRVYNLLRYAIGGCRPDHDRAVMLAYQGPDEPQQFVKIVDFPGGITKFCIRRDPESDRYVALINRITRQDAPAARNVLSLSTSEDLVHWQVHADLIDYRDSDPGLIGFQYPDFQMVGDDLLALSRTAFNGAHSFHDSNFITFHRISNFRALYQRRVEQA